MPKIRTVKVLYSIESFYLNYLIFELIILFKYGYKYTIVYLYYCSENRQYSL